MKNNSAVVRPDPVFPEVADHIERVRFLKRLKTIARFAEIFMEGSAEEVRSKRDELEAGKHLLDDPRSLDLCENLILAFTARLYAIPHERHLAEHLDVD